MGGVFTHMVGAQGAAGGGAPFQFGNSTDSGFNTSLGVDQFRGYTEQAVASGTINNLVIVGASSGGFTGDYRLVIYAANSATDISGALLGQTADQTSLGLLETKTVPLLAPVNIVSGNWYAIGVHGGTGVTNVRDSTSANGRFFSDTFSDGSPNPAPASLGNGASTPLVYGTS